MQLIFEDRQRRIIRGRGEIKFSSFSSFHLVVLTARVRSEKQISKGATNDEDLVVKIDGKTFPKLTAPKRLIDSPAAFSGGQLHNLSKTVYFLLFLKGRDYTIVLETDKPHNTATFESLEIYTLSLNKTLPLGIRKQAEDGDRRSWITFALVDLPLALFRVIAIAKKRYRDSDDLKIIVDGKTRAHFEPEDESPPPPRPLEWFYRFWYFVGSVLLGKSTSYSFKTALPKGLHYIELHADRMPTVESIEFEFGETPALPLAEEIQKYKDEVFGRDYNQLDQYIQDAVSFWNEFFLKQDYPPPEPLDPNLVKTIIYRESRLGYYPDEDVIDVMQVWDPENPARSTLLDETPESEFITPNKIDYISYSYPKDKIPPKVESREESIFWGVRWLYHKAQHLQTVPGSETELVKPYVRKWRSWKKAIRGYNANEQIVEEYLKEVFSVYEKAVDLKGNVLWEK